MFDKSAQPNSQEQLSTLATQLFVYLFIHLCIYIIYIYIYIYYIYIYNEYV